MDNLLENYCVSRHMRHGKLQFGVNLNDSLQAQCSLFLNMAIILISSHYERVVLSFDSICKSFPVNDSSQETWGILNYRTKKNLFMYLLIRQFLLSGN